LAIGTFRLELDVAPLRSSRGRKGKDWKVIGGWELGKFVDGTHLKDGASRDWGFEDIEIANGKVIEDKGEVDSMLEEDQPVGSQVPDIQVHVPARM